MSISECVCTLIVVENRWHPSLRDTTAFLFFFLGGGGDEVRQMRSLISLPGSLHIARLACNRESIFWRMIDHQKQTW